MKTSVKQVQQTKRKLGTITVDDVQFILARQVIPHPLLYTEFLKLIIDLEYKNKVCPLPITLLQHYTVKIGEKVAIRHTNSLKSAKAL